MSLTPEQARQMSPLVLAYIGDAVHDLLSRLDVASEGLSMRATHAAVVSRVNARAQADNLRRCAALLSDDEMSIVRWGRNAHARHAAPKSAGPAAYAASTGFETLVGYLYVTDQMDRLRFLLSQPVVPAKEEPCQPPS